MPLWHRVLSLGVAHCVCFMIVSKFEFASSQVRVSMTYRGKPRDDEDRGLQHMCMYKCGLPYARES